MRVFVTGGSGFIGSATVPELINSGHQVVALARSDTTAATLEAAGADVLRGDLNDLEVLRAGASESDGVIHLAFIHDFSRYAECAQADYRAIDALGTSLEGSDRPLVIASGLAVVAAGELIKETDSPEPNFPRSASADLALSFVDHGVRSSVMRLAPTVHGEGDHGFVPRLIDIARETGVSGYVGDGANKWPGVHRKDAALLFRLALENAPAGSILHAVEDEGVETRTIAGVIGRHLDVPVASIPSEKAIEHFGFLGVFFAANLATSSDATRELLDWKPAHPGLIEDLDQGHYFDASSGRG